MLYFILNPASQSGQSTNLFHSLTPILRQKNVSYELLTSEYPGHLTGLTAELIASHADSATPVNLIVLGGDGTLNEVLQGISDFSKINLGYIPTGSGNDFARSMNLSHSPAQLLNTILENIESGNVHKLDLGTIRYVNHETSSKQTRHFIGSSGLGFDAAVCVEVQQSKLKSILNKIHLGQLIYLCIALKQIILAKLGSCDIILDGKDTIHLKHMLFISSMIHKFEGGGLKICPHAKADDGLLDICVVDSVPKILVPFILPTAYFGKHFFYPTVNEYHASKVEIKTSRPLWLHTDGEPSHQTRHLVIECKKQMISFLL